MERNAGDHPTDGGDQIGSLMELFRDSSKDPLGPFAPGHGEFAPRYKALAELVKFGDAAVELLCQALQDPDAYTRRFAAEALARIGDARAVVPLIVAFQESELYVQRYVASALATLGDAQAVAPLYDALQTPDIAQEASVALEAVLKRAASTVSTKMLRLVASLKDNGRYIAEVPNTDGGYLCWEHVEGGLDYRTVKALARQELSRRGLVV